MDISGYVVLGIVTLFLVYLMPQLIRGRQDVVDSRLADRFSADLRILATAGAAGGGSRPAADDSAPRAYLHDPRLRTEVSAMNRPITRVAQPVTSDSVNPGEKRESNSHPMPALAHRPSASVSAARSGPPAGQRVASGAPSSRGPARAEASRRRRAAARRRLVLTLVLLTLSATAWVAVAAGAGHVALALAPTGLLALVLVLGRRAAAASARAERAARLASGRPARPVAVAPKSSRPAATSSRGSARPASRPAGRDARAAHTGTTQVIAAQRHNVNAQRPAAQNGVAQPAAAAASAPAVGARQAAIAASTDSARAGSARGGSARAGSARAGAPVGAGGVRASREAGTELIPRVRLSETPAPENLQAVQRSDGALGETSGEPVAARLGDAPAPDSRADAAVAAVEVAEPAAHDDVAATRAEAAGAERVGAPASGAQAPGDVAAQASRAPSGRSWTPVPVPVPTYTLKPTAPRHNPPDLSAAEGGPQAVEAPVAAGSVEATDAVGQVSEATVADTPAQEPATSADQSPQEPIEEPSEAALDLDAVLSRRRASGE